MTALAAPQVIGRYAVYGKIASGGMASVCFGRLIGGEGFARTVAIKRLHPHLAEDPEFRATLVDEARMAARIHHPNVVPTLDVVTADGELLLVMEYVRGESLARLFKTEWARRRPLPLPIVGAVATGALHGLHAAHEATSDNGSPLGIVHRDVSPQNLLVGVDGLPRLIDFGVAKAVGNVQTTREGNIKGKIAYMAPEQIGSRNVDRRADVYAMGVILWEMLASQRLFQADNDVALVAKVIAGVEDPPSAFVPGLPPGVDELVMRALATDPEDRFATAEDMAARLVRLLPPALPTDVGKWVEEAAKATLTQRGAELAEIESHSGIDRVPSPPVSVRSIHSTGSRRIAPFPPPVASSPSLPAAPSPSHPGASSSSSHGAHGPSSSSSRDAPSKPSAISRSGSSISEATELPADALLPDSPSQRSSLSLRTAASSIVPPPRSWFAMAAGAFGVGLLLAVGAMALVRSVSPATSAAPSQGSNAAATQPAGPGTNGDSGTAASPPSTGVPPSVPVTALPQAPVPIPPPPPPQPHSSRPQASPHPSPPPSAAPPTKPKSGCNPPYVIDSAGDRQYKPECL